MRLENLRADSTFKLACSGQMVKKQLVDNWLIFRRKGSALGLLSEADQLRLSDYRLVRRLWCVMRTHSVVVQGPCRLRCMGDNAEYGVCPDNRLLKYRVSRRLRSCSGSS